MVESEDLVICPTLNIDFLFTDSNNHTRVFFKNRVEGRESMFRVMVLRLQHELELNSY